MIETPSPRDRFDKIDFHLVRIQESISIARLELARLKELHDPETGP